MTGLGSPCGACKFLRRKCVRGCVFAPYFCHEQGASHFAAIHKVFGASNVSKLLMHLPVTDRSEAAITISYEAQARLQDPIYGCVAHIFALQQQVVSLQAQLASLKAHQAAQGAGNNIHGLAEASVAQEAGKAYNRYAAYQQDVQGFMAQAMDERMNKPSSSNPMMNCESSSQDDFISSSVEDESYCEMRTAYNYRDMEDLQSIAYAYLHRS
ncbi:LOB domain-containing protein 29-like [Phalaenopsis equestris]|uniref:LOB domain-containing protein 29-like n=1 Tax=Phalaenopsis equestris TaxID=78828 RepID=UPI0009E22DD8|nr:LOB domain-containing protein 29-like [Phalaenopsis equestris]